MIYEYRCAKCEHVFDKTVKMADREVPLSEPCPACGETGSVAQFHSAGVAMSYSSATPKVDSTFQKYVVGPMFHKIPKHMRAEPKTKIPREF